jgi:two-component system response regulator HydG
MKTPSSEHRILVVDDDTYICKLLSNYLGKNGFTVETAYSGTTARKLIRQVTFDLILCDYRLPDGNGLEIMLAARKRSLQTKVVIITAYKEVSTAVELMKAGAADYLTKPLIPEEVLSVAREAFSSPAEKVASDSIEDDFIAGKSHNFLKVLEHINLVAPVDMTIVIEGETGSGKEYIARLIHERSRRKGKPFIAVDCGALPEGIVNSELFGHIKGAFTGATSDKKGFFESAGGGTLFLDEISNLNAENQVKLLRVLQENVITRVGDTRPIPVDVRLVVALNQQLTSEVEKHNMREDLYHRLNEFKISVPPIRERGEDIFIFAEAFLEKAAKRFNKDVNRFSEEVKQTLLKYPWPGNIREIRNVVNRAVLLATGSEITIDVLPEEIRNNQPITARDTDFSLSGQELKEVSALAEKEAILSALRTAGNNKSEAARLLNIDRKTLYNKMSQLGVNTNGQKQKT